MLYSCLLITLVQQALRLRNTPCWSAAKPDPTIKTAGTVLRNRVPLLALLDRYVSVAKACGGQKNGAPWRKLHHDLQIPEVKVTALLVIVGPE